MQKTAWIKKEHLGGLCSEEDKKMASIPSREVLIRKVVGVMLLRVGR